MFSVLPEVLSRQVLLHNHQKSNKTEINLFILLSFAYIVKDWHKNLSHVNVYRYSGR